MPPADPTPIRPSVIIQWGKDDLASRERFLRALALTGGTATGVGRRLIDRWTDIVLARLPSDIEAAALEDVEDLARVAEAPGAATVQPDIRRPVTYPPAAAASRRRP